MTEQSSPVPTKAHAPSPLDIPARTAAAKPASPRPARRLAAAPRAVRRQARSARAAGAQPAAPAGRGRGRTPPHPAPVRVTGAQALVMALERVGVDVVFGIPGGAVLPAYDPLLDSSQIRHILVRHEQGAGHAATGYAQATGRTGVCMATSGPGATNLVTPLADAYMDSVPVVAITGQVATNLIGTDGFQEADISGITYPITKHNFLVTKPEDIARTIGEAFHLASTGRPGPVLVDIAKDAMQATTDFTWPVPFDLPGYHPVTRPHSRQVREAARMIAEAKRPVLYVGGGVIKADAARELQGPGGADRRPGCHHADGPRRLPGQPPAAPGHARHARHGRRGRRAAEVGPPRGPRRPVRRPGHRQARLLRAGRADRARRHRPGGDLQEPPGRRPDRRRLQGGHRRPDHRGAQPTTSTASRATTPNGGRSWSSGAASTRSATTSPTTAAWRRST